MNSIKYITHCINVTLCLQVLLLAVLTCGTKVSADRHRPPLPPRNVMQSSAGECFDVGGHKCDLCCSSRCCEEVAGGPQLPPTDEIVVFPVRFALVTDETNSKSLSISRGVALSQLRVVNRAFEGSRSKLRFCLDVNDVASGSDDGLAPHATADDAVVTVHDSRMSASCNTDPCYRNPETCDFYQYTLPAIVRDPSRWVNIVLCDIPYDGESQFPWATSEGSPLQYVQVRYGAVATKGDGSKRDGGKSLVHELGHYFGLLHTFDGGCATPGDYVDDTPPSLNAANIGLDCASLNGSASSCGAAFPPDDRSNYMDYAADTCMNHFTPGQIVRMEESLVKYRPLLLKSSRSIFWDRRWQELSDDIALVCTRKANIEQAHRGGVTMSRSSAEIEVEVTSVRVWLGVVFIFGYVAMQVGFSVWESDGRKRKRRFRFLGTSR